MSTTGDDDSKVTDLGAFRAKRQAPSERERFSVLGQELRAIAAPAVEALQAAGHDVTPQELVAERLEAVALAQHGPEAAAKVRQNAIDFFESIGNKAAARRFRLRNCQQRDYNDGTDVQELR